MNIIYAYNTFISKNLVISSIVPIDGSTKTYSKAQYFGTEIVSKKCASIESLSFTVFGEMLEENRKKEANSKGNEVKSGSIFTKSIKIWKLVLKPLLVYHSQVDRIIKNKYNM